MSKMSLAGKTALVTGASSGIGREIAIELARKGCGVAVNHFEGAAGANETANQIREIGGQAFPIAAHVGRFSEVDPMFRTVVERFGKLDILVNNAGVQTWSPLLELAESEWDRVIETNLKGTFLCTQRAGRLMKVTGGGRIINIGSGSNKFAFPRLVDYTASKGGIEMFTKVAASELGPLGITVNCIAPGAIETERTKRETPDYADTWGELAPMRRVGNPLDVATAVCFVASDEAEFITGHTIFVDGGLFTTPHWPYER